MTKSQQIYPTDLNDTQWSKIRPYLPAEAQTGRPREHGWWMILNGIFYLLQSGCSWRMLPRDLPPWKTVYHYFRLWRTNGTWERVNRLLRERVRLKFGKKRQPSASILDSQSVKTSEGGLARGFDAGKKVTGRKRYTLVDTLGLILKVVVTAGNVQDRDGARHLLEELANQKTTIRLDAVAFIWKELGTGCENLLGAHKLIQAFSAVSRIASPALLFKSEAIVHPDDDVKYIAPDECQLSYNLLLMALFWNSVYTKKHLHGFSQLSTQGDITLEPLDFLVFG